MTLTVGTLKDILATLGPEWSTAAVVIRETSGSEHFAEDAVDVQNISKRDGSVYSRELHITTN